MSGPVSAAPPPMKIAIVSDAWHPQVNGVVTTYANTSDHLKEQGHDLLMVTPNDFTTVPLPGYKSIRVAVWPWRDVPRRLRDFDPEAIHIATEGPLGHAALRYCRRREIAFTSSFHTQFPEYLRARMPIPVGWSYRYVRRFHGQAIRTLVPTETQRRQLADRGFDKLAVWSRGVDTDLFKPRDKSILDVPRPVAMYMGRVAVEKNIEAFLGMPFAGSKVVIGDGPARKRLQAQFPDSHWLGQKLGEELARYLAAGDVFVFPSRTDTFGVVLLEAMACGLPVAAYPVTGPLDVIDHGMSGYLDNDLATATAKALELDPADCVAHAAKFSWSACASHFAELLSPN